jgi:hypothetical protein
MEVTKLPTELGHSVGSFVTSILESLLITSSCLGLPSKLRSQCSSGLPNYS